MDAVAPDGPECARKGLRSPADMQSLFRAATEAWGGDGGSRGGMYDGAGAGAT